MEHKTIRALKKDRRQRRERAIAPEQARVTASGYIVRQYPLGCLGGTPYSLPLAAGDLWVVPIVLTSPGCGVVGDVGVVAIDNRTGEVVSGSPPEEVRLAVQRLKEEKRDALEAAFLQARKC